MKVCRLLMLVSAVMQLSLACSGEYVTEQPSVPRTKAVFTISAATKDAAADSGVSSLDVLVFREVDSRLDAASRVEGESLEIEVSKGIGLRYYLVANASNGMFDDVRDESGFLGKVSFLQDNRRGHLIMLGAGSAVLQTARRFEVKVRHLLSKVVLDTVTAEFQGYVDDAASVLLRSVYLINTPAYVPFASGNLIPEIWFNAMRPGNTVPDSHPMSEAEEMLLRRDLGIAVTGPETMDVGVELYCCPNPCRDDVSAVTSPSWSPRRTRLVVEMSVEGVSCFYPVTLPELEPGKMYRIRNLRLMSLGSDNPDVPVSRIPPVFSLTVTEWLEDEREIHFFD